MGCVGGLGVYTGLGVFISGSGVGVWGVLYFWVFILGPFGLLYCNHKDQICKMPKVRD